jgi:hypothetical protein
MFPTRIDDEGKWWPMPLGMTIDQRRYFFNGPLAALPGGQILKIWTIQGVPIHNIIHILMMLRVSLPSNGFTSF